VIYIYRDTKDPVATLASVTEQRWINIQEELNQLQKKVNQLCSQRGLSQSSPVKRCSENKKAAFKDLVIEMDPAFMAKSVIYLALKLAQLVDVHFSSHVHSSVEAKTVPQDIWPLSDPSKSRLSHQMALTLIWKPVGLDPVLKSSPTVPVVHGEVNIARYFGRLLDLGLYETSPNVNWVDQQLDSLHQLAHSAREAKYRPTLAKAMAKVKRPSTMTAATLADVIYASMFSRSKDLAPILSTTFVPIPDL
jgi:hypothetical protein